MSIAENQREARIQEKGEPKLRLDFDVFDDGSVSMWTHFNHGDDFNVVKKRLEAIRDHLLEFLTDDGMCPFNITAKEVDSAPPAGGEHDPEEGTWAWALEQMKAGKRVTIDDPRLKYVGLTLALGLYDGEFYECHQYEGKWVRGSKAFIFNAADFERTDWQMVERLKDES